MTPPTHTLFQLTGDTQHSFTSGRCFIPPFASLFDCASGFAWYISQRPIAGWVVMPRVPHAKSLINCGRVPPVHIAAPVPILQRLKAARASGCPRCSPRLDPSGALITALWRHGSQPFRDFRALLPRCRGMVIDPFLAPSTAPCRGIALM